jgi:TolA-binding protein
MLSDYFDAMKTLIITALCGIFLLSGCAGNRQFSAIKPLQMRNLPPLQSMVTATESIKDPAEEYPEKNEMPSSQPENPKRKLPTLREMVQMVESRQDIAESRLDSLESDVQEVKQAVRSLQSAPALPAKKNVSASRDKKNEKKLSEKITAAPDELIIPDVNNTGKNKKKIVNPASEISGDELLKPDNKSAKNRMAAKQNKESDSLQSIAKKKQAAIVPPASPATPPSNPAPVTAPLQQSATAAKDSKENNPADSTAPGSPYRKAMQFLKKRMYSEAAAQLNEALLSERNPQIISNSNYWLGESYFGMGKFTEAADAFRKVLSSKTSTKLDDAQIMLAETYLKMGNQPEARKQFQRVLDAYPSSEFVPRARRMLQQL